MHSGMTELRRQRSEIRAAEAAQQLEERKAVQSKGPNPAWGFPEGSWLSMYKVRLREA